MLETSNLIPSSSVIPGRPSIPEPLYLVPFKPARDCAGSEGLSSFLPEKSGWRRGKVAEGTGELPGPGTFFPPGPGHSDDRLQLATRSRCCCRSSSRCSRSRCAASCRRTGSTPGPGRGPASLAGTTGGVSVSATVGGFDSARVFLDLALGEPFASPLPPLPEWPLPPLVGGAPVSSAILRARTSSVMMPSSSWTAGVEEARRQPAHDVVGQRLRERDLRVGRHALGVEAHVAELAHERLQRHAVLEPDRDRGRERVHHPAQRRAVLADVGEEDLAQRAVLVLAGGDVALVAGDRELVRQRLALARQPVARRAGSCGSTRLDPSSSCAFVRSACAVLEPSR